MPIACSIWPQVKHPIMNSDFNGPSLVTMLRNMWSKPRHQTDKFIVIGLNPIIVISHFLPYHFGLFAKKIFSYFFLHLLDFHVHQSTLLPQLYPFFFKFVDSKVSLLDFFLKPHALCSLRLCDPSFLGFANHHIYGCYYAWTRLCMLHKDYNIYSILQRRK